MKRYRVALVVDHFLPRVGGIELHVRDLARQLQQHGCEATVITTTPGPERCDDVEVIRIPARLLPRFRIACDPRSFARLRDVLNSDRFEVVHSHGSVVSPLAYGAVYWSARLKLPHLLTVHSLLKRTAALFAALVGVTRWDCDTTVWSTVSTFNAARIRAASGLKEVHVVPNGIDVAAWQVQPRPHRPARVVSVMRLNSKKRPFDLIDAAATVVAKLGETVRFTVVGDGPCRKSLERYVARLGLGRTVEIVGALPRPAIRALFETTDLFVLPTRLEAFGIAVLEALAAGLPVVAMNRSGVTDLIEPGREGYLADGPDDFAERIIDLLIDEPKRAEMSRHAVIKAQQFAWPSVVLQHEQLYELATAKMTPTPARA